MRQDLIQELIDNEQLFYDLQSIIGRFLDVDHLLAQLVQVCWYILILWKLSDLLFIFIHCFRISRKSWKNISSVLIVDHGQMTICTCHTNYLPWMVSDFKKGCNYTGLEWQIFQSLAWHLILKMQIVNKSCINSTMRLHPELFCMMIYQSQLPVSGSWNSLLLSLANVVEWIPGQSGVWNAITCEDWCSCTYTKHMHPILAHTTQLNISTVKETKLDLNIDTHNTEL